MAATKASRRDSGVERPRPDGYGSSVTHRTDMIPLHLRAPRCELPRRARDRGGSASCRALDVACRDRRRRRRDASRVVERVGVAMGSELRLTAWTDDEAAARAAFDAVFAEFERLEALMSTWRPGSDVVRINAAAGVQAVPVAPDVRDVLRQARQISEWTDGTFDVTFGALTDVWKFDQDQDNSIPSPRSHSRAAAADRLPADRDRRSRRHGVPQAQGDADSPRRHRQGLRGRSRACRSCARPACATS